MLHNVQFNDCGLSLQVQVTFAKRGKIKVSTLKLLFAVSAGFLRGNLSSEAGVSVSTDPAPAFNRSEFESYLWYVYQDRDPATNAEFYRLYFAPTLNETAIFGHLDLDSDRPLFAKSVRSDNNPSTPETAFTWNITLTEFHSYPPFGFAETYYQIRSSTNNTMHIWYSRFCQTNRG
ncbi:hypothetical protein R3P38DRAFT_2809414 [Favolaschia claudopus]|uniref:Uncharacterized protein n=1 Tax=Favolaschia claudopus TaxID=2862362 RepID=A0AAV9ZDM3_9AGAR